MSTRTRVGIFIFLVLIFASFYSVNDGFSQTREESVNASQKFIKSYPELRSAELGKIHSTIIEWKSSSTPEVYARANNLIFSDNKIQVYVYLDNAESISKIPQDIDVVASDENIAVAFVSSEQINQLAQLDFVEQISPPIMAVPRETSREPIDEISKIDDSKINSLIIEWITDPNPDSFAEENNLIFSDNKIQVYVYLDNAESISKIPQDIDVVASDENIAVAFVSSDQIGQLAQLDFVEQITLPVQARNPPIPILQEDNEIDDSNWIGIGIGIGIAIIVGVVYSKRKKVIKRKH